MQPSKKIPTVELLHLGQSPWLDQIGRSLIDSGRLEWMVKEWGLTGVTSNPTIFERAIGQSNDYDEDIFRLASRGMTPPEIYDELTTNDVRRAADILLPVYEKTGGGDGYVSIEPLASLAYDAEKTVSEVNRVAAKVGRQNVLIKVPGTPEGVWAIRRLIAEGYNINVTLLFSLRQYEAVAEAYLGGLEELMAKRTLLTRVYSVASVFVSRIDTAVDGRLSEVSRGGVSGYFGKVAVANSKMIYERFGELFKSFRFRRLKERNARVQRVLWASTSTKNPKLSDIKYVEELIGPDTINTLPLATMEAFNDHGEAKEALTMNLGEASQILKALPEFGIDLEEVCDQLQRDGVEAFDKSYRSLLEVLEKKAVAILK